MAKDSPGVRELMAQGATLEAALADVTARIYVIDLADVKVFVGALLGGMLVSYMAVLKVQDKFGVAIHQLLGRRRCRQGVLPCRGPERRGRARLSPRGHGLVADEIYPVEQG
jgi:hypothetical protein